MKAAVIIAALMAAATNAASASPFLSHLLFPEINREALMKMQSHNESPVEQIPQFPDPVFRARMYFLMNNTMEQTIDMFVDMPNKAAKVVINLKNYQGNGAKAEMLMIGVSICNSIVPVRKYLFREI